MYKLVDILENNTGCSSCNRSRKLNENYPEADIQRFIKKFKEEADDLNIEVTDNQLRSYIKIFDKVRDSLPTDKKRIENWKVADLIRLATRKKRSGEEEEEPEEEEITPDVVYHNDDNTIVVYSGDTEGKCVMYGKGERWCITRSSYPNYRYSARGQYPVFYLAKNNNLPSSNKLSFVAIQVRNPQTTSEEDRYVYTDRSNDPYESSPMSFSELERRVPWLKEIPNLKSILKYIPLTSKEKITNKYKSNPATYKEWTKFPYKTKEQYLVIRKDYQGGYSGQGLFSDITNEQFVRIYLPKYPDVLRFVTETPGIIDPELLLSNLDNFPDSARRSVTANLQQPIDTKELDSSSLPFDVKKLLVKLKKWKLEPDERLYITQDGDTIVKLTLGGDLKMGLYQAEDDFPNVKINKRTSRFLLDYPELNKIPLALLVNLSEKGAIDSEVPKKVIDDSKKDPNSSLAVRKVGNEEIIVDSNTLSAYKLKGNQISQIPFDSEEAQSVYKDAQEKGTFKKNILNVFTGKLKDLPATINTQALARVINSLPYGERTVPIPMGYGGDIIDSVALVDPGSGNIFLAKASPEEGRDFVNSLREYKGNEARSSNIFNQSQFAEYFKYLRDKNISINDEQLIEALRACLGNLRIINYFFDAEPPLDPDNVLIPVKDGDTWYLLNTADRRQSYRVNPQTGNVISAILSQGRYDQLYRMARPDQAPAQEPAQGAAVNVRAPRDQGQQPVRWQQPAPTGDVNIANTMNALGAANQFRQIPANDLRRLNITNGAPLNVRVDGGARRRNQLLGDAGQVTNAYAALTSRIYVIRLANGTNVISIKVYPGNREYLLIPGQTALQLNEPTALLTALRQRNLAEMKKYLVRSYLDTNPKNLEEFKNILRKHINK